MEWGTKARCEQKRSDCFVWFFFVSFDWMSFMFDFYLVLLSHHIIFFLCLVFGWDSITVHYSSSSGVSVHQEVFLDGPIMRKLFLHEHTMRTSSMNLWRETSRIEKDIFSSLMSARGNEGKCLCLCACLSVRVSCYLLSLASVSASHQSKHRSALFCAKKIQIKEK